MVNQNTKPRAIAATLLAVVLAIGVLGGVAIDRLLLLPRGAIASEVTGPQVGDPAGPSGRETRRPPGSSDGYLEFLTRELEITEDQRSRIEEILQHQQERVLEITSETRPALRAVAIETRSSIDDVLSPEQRERLGELRERRDRMRDGHQREGRPGGPGPGPGTGN